MTRRATFFPARTALGPSLAVTLILDLAGKHRAAVAINVGCSRKAIKISPPFFGLK
jgi:hypothetical protein